MVCTTWYAIMGMLYAIGKGEQSLDDFERILHAKDPCLCPPASADGLYFINAYYPDKWQTLSDLPLTPQWLNLPN